MHFVHVHLSGIKKSVLHHLFPVFPAIPPVQMRKDTGLVSINILSTFNVDNYRSRIQIKFSCLNEVMHIFESP